MDALPEDVRAKAKEWLDWDFNPKTRSEIETLIKDGKVADLRAALMERIAFGR